MKLEHLMLKYEITPKHLDVISAAMLSNIGLTETSIKMEGKLTPDQVFVVAKALCLEDHGECIEDIAPLMMFERIKLNETRTDTWKSQSDYTKEVKRLTAIKEDLGLLVLERDGVINIRELEA
jgi:hypothetical protein